MIIFDLDGTLADCEHRRHFVHPTCSECKQTLTNEIKFDLGWHCQYPCDHVTHKSDWKPDWKAFYEACDQDKLIEPTYKILSSLQYQGWGPIQIWSGRCESVREKTNTWLLMNGFTDNELLETLKMRPEGLDCPQERLFEHWLRERSSDYMESLLNGTTFKNHNIQMAFLSHKPTIDLFRRHGIFVFDCAQNDEEF